MRENKTVLNGGGEYTYGTGKNPPTELQAEIIDYIHKWTNHRFQGWSSREAYKFIQDHHNEARNQEAIELSCTRRFVGFR